MSGTYRCSFEVDASVERVWRAFTDPEEQARLFTPPEGAPEPPGEITTKLLEAEPQRRLKWSQEAAHLADRGEFTVEIEPTETGARFTVTRESFGEGEDADVFGESNGLGWEHGFRDLAFYLETGQILQRHYYGCSKSCTGMVFRERSWGIEVCRVSPGSFAEEAGLVRGDRLVRLAGVPIYTREDIWLLNIEHAPGTECEVEFVRDGERHTRTGRFSELGLRVVGE